MRRKLPARVIGLYPDRDKWRLLLCEHGKKKSIILPNKEEAERLAKELDSQFKRAETQRLDDVITQWVEYRQRMGAGQSETISYQAGRLRVFLRDYIDQQIEALTPKRAAALYERALVVPTKKTGHPLAAASHHFYLRLAKSFFAWAADRGHVGVNPFAKVVPVGKENIGKSQLRLDEARKFLDAAFSYYERKRHPLAIAAAVALFMGLRTSEILKRQVRDVEAEGSYLCIASGKTHNAARRPEVPERLRPYLLELSQGKRAEDLLFSTRSDGKPVRRQLLHAMVQRLCKLADVPVVCTHSLRGLFATLGVQSGAATHAVAATLGHGSFAVTQRHYAQPDAVVNSKMSRVSSLLTGEQPGVFLSSLTADQILARLDASMRAQLLALLAAPGGEKQPD